MPTLLYRQYTSVCIHICLYRACWPKIKHVTFHPHDGFFDVGLIIGILTCLIWYLKNKLQTEKYFRYWSVYPTVMADNEKTHVYWWSFGMSHRQHLRMALDLVLPVTEPSLPFMFITPWVPHSNHRQHARFSVSLHMNLREQHNGILVITQYILSLTNPDKGFSSSYVFSGKSHI